VLAAETPEAARRVLERHLADIDARTARLQRIAHGLRQIITEREDIVNVTAADPTVDQEARRRLAIDLFNHAWTLLETENRTPDQDDEMLHAAHASRYHWGEAGDATHRARGEWQCSRVYVTLGRSEPAVHHARRCLAICEEHKIGGWDLAAAYEAVARASRLAGDEGALAHFRGLATAQLDRIADEEDRRIIAADVATL
jgi:hypothetical protein